MLKSEVKEILESRGYVSHYSGIVCDVYDWRGDLAGRCLVHTIERITQESNCIKAWKPYEGATRYAHYLSKHYQQWENREHCRRIAEELEAYANGRVFRCPECGEIVTIPDDVGDMYKCEHCGEIAPTGEGYGKNAWEECYISDYFDDVLDVEYTTNYLKEYKAVSVCVAWGGPNIYIETASGYVNLYWGGDHETWPIDCDTVTEIDDYWEEAFNCL